MHVNEGASNAEKFCTSVEFAYEETNTYIHCTEKNILKFLKYLVVKVISSLSMRVKSKRIAKTGLFSEQSLLRRIKKSPKFPAM